MKQNILIHSINWIWLWHIKRTILIANKLRELKNVWKIIFLTNSTNPFLILNEWYEVIKLDYWIEDTLKWISFNKYELENYKKINEIIEKNKIDIVLHDTYFIKLLIEKRKDIKHYLVLRDSKIDYLKTIEEYLFNFKKIFIPHIKEEILSEKIDFFNKFKNIIYTWYVFEEQITLSKNNNKKIIISPWYWWDFDETLKFFIYVNDFLKHNKKLIKEYEIVFILWKFYEIIKDKVVFDDKFILVQFIEDLSKKFWEIDIFIWRAWYNSINEVVFNNTKSLIFPVKTTNESQENRVDFFLNSFNLKHLIKWEYIINIDTKNFQKLIKNNFKENKLKELFKWATEIKNIFKKDLEIKNILIFKHIFLPISENFIHEEITGFSDINPIIFTLKKDNLDIFKNNLEILYIEEFNKLLNLEYPKIYDKSLYIKLLKYIVYIIKKYEIQLIYTEFLFDAFLINKVKSILPNIKIISAWRGYDVYTFLKNTYVNPELLLTNLDKILVRDHSMYDEIHSYWVKKNNIEVVRSVMNFSKYNFIYKDFSKLDIIIWWRFVYKKGLLELLYLINFLSREQFVWKIWLVWDWELKEEILNKIERLWLSSKIKYYGFLAHKDFTLKLNEYNCFINYSRVPKNWDNEWTNNVVSENILSWNVVFSTVVWWIWEIIKDNETWIVLSGNPEEDFLKIKKIFNSIKISDLVERGHLLVNRLLWKKQSIEKLEDIIKSYI